MSELWLTADLGNSRLKLRTWRLDAVPARTPRRCAGTELSGDVELLAPRLETWLAAQPARPVCALSSVASAGRSASIRSVLGEHTELLGEGLEPNLENVTSDPPGVGLDRLWAARGAATVVAGSVIVADAGTALTVDAVEVQAGADRRPRFLGGAIAPGPQLLARALAEGTARLPLVEPRPGAAALGRDTPAAIRAGIGVGFRGAARELVERMREESGLAEAPLVLTGGAAAFLLEPEPVFDGELVVEEDLVHLGLLDAAREFRDRGAGAAEERDRSRGTSAPEEDEA